MNEEIPPIVRPFSSYRNEALSASVSTRTSYRLDARPPQMKTTLVAGTAPEIVDAVRNAIFEYRVQNGKPGK